MSTLFGPMRQIGFVVHDLEAAMRHWIDVCKIGPFFYFQHSAYETFTYNGTRYDDINVSVAFANSGDIQIEIIQQRCTTPSMYMEWFSAGHEGMQHWCSWPEDYQERYDAARRQGYEVAMEGMHARGPFVYFRPAGHPGTVIEMAALTPGRRAFFDRVRDAARDWDGRDPIRRL